MTLSLSISHLLEWLAFVTRKIKSFCPPEAMILENGTYMMCSTSPEQSAIRTAGAITGGVDTIHRLERRVGALSPDMSCSFSKIPAALPKVKSVSEVTASNVLIGTEGSAVSCTYLRS